MKTYLIVRVLLALHITGIVIMAGTTMIDYLTFRTFCQFTDTGDDRATGLIPLMAKYGAFVRTGAITLILTGVALFVIDKGEIWGQVWFKVKLALIIAVVVNGIFSGNKQGHRLRATVMAHTTGFSQYIAIIRESLSRFYPIQLTLFFLLILVSMLRSNMVR